MEIETNMTAQTSEASEGNAAAGNGNADVTEATETARDTDTEFADPGTGQEPEKPRQSDAQNSENARRRREAQQRRAQAELERERRAARDAAVLDILGGQNPYTGEEMKDSLDVEEYLTMKEIDGKGGDPLGDFLKYRKEKERQREQKAAEEAQTEEWYRQDREAFVERYPDVDLTALIEDEGFQLFAEGKTGKRPLSEIYEGYCSLRGEQTARARQMAAQMLANKKASPGALSNSNGGERDFFSAEDVRKMSQSEVHKHYDKIMKSMKKW